MTPERDLADALERVSDYVSERATESPKVKRLQPTKAPRMVDLGARWRKELPLPMMATKRCVGQAVRQARAAAVGSRALAARLVLHVAASRGAAP